MNPLKSTLCLSALLLTGACGGGTQSPAQVTPTPVTVQAPIMTGLATVAPTGMIQVSTQPQDGCSFTWELTGDPKARIIAGQGEPAITIGDFTQGLPSESMTATVTVRTDPSPTHGDLVVLGVHSFTVTADPSSPAVITK